MNQRNNNIVNTVVGILTILICISALLYTVPKFYFDPKAYKVIAKFNNVDCLQQGADVLVAGIRIGRVSLIHLDEDYNAVVHMDINNTVAIPDDSQASITSISLLGEKIVSITPGASNVNINPGETIKLVRNPITIENIIDKAVYILTNSKK